MLCSAEETLRAFQASLVTEKQYIEDPGVVLSSGRLMCRMKGRLYRWSEAQPAVMGALAFGGDWEGMLRGGIRIAEPPSSAEAADQAKKEVCLR